VGTRKMNFGLGIVRIMTLDPSRRLCSIILYYFRNANNFTLCLVRCRPYDGMIHHLALGTVSLGWLPPPQESEHFSRVRKAVFLSWFGVAFSLFFMFLLAE